MLLKRACAQRRKWSSLKVRKILKQQTLYLLQQSISDIILSQTIQATTPKEAWNILKEELQGNVMVHTIKLQSLKIVLENLKLKDCEATKDYFSQIMKIIIINQIRSFGENIYGERITQKVLITLTAKYDPIIVVSWSTWVDQ